MLPSFAFIALLLGTSHAGVLTWDHSVERRAVGLSLVPDWKLEGSNLDPTCKKVLQQSINCDSYVDELRYKEYHGSLEDSSLTNTVCSVQCERALFTAQRRISAACAKTPELFTGVPVNSLIDPIVSGWNETCLKEESTGKYCNDIIESWGDFETLEDMPQEQLCSYCFGEKLRQMQRSPYSAYDDLFAKQLEYINSKCDSESPTEPLENPIKVNYTMPETCSDSKVYVAQDGDTCDSIALAKSISAATLYYDNSNLRNCSNIETGLELCIPESCKTYQVEENDDCIRIGVDYGTSWRSIVDWNLALDSKCSNLWGARPSWGSVICLSPPGGDFEDQGSGTDNPNPGKDNLGGQGGSGDGYGEKLVKPPSGTIAKGTTAKCGEYIEAQDGSSCRKLLASAEKAATMDLFLKANPSLKTSSECDNNLIPDTWYCLRPLPYFGSQA